MRVFEKQWNGFKANRGAKMEEGKAIELTDANFEEEVLKSEVPVLVDFWATWCGPCQAASPVLDKIAGEYTGKLKVCKLSTGL